MATPQLATFKVPAIENEPMVSGLFLFILESQTHSSLS